MPFSLVLLLLACSDADTNLDDYHRGLFALSQGQYDWAKRYFEADLRQHPERAASLKGLSRSYYSGNVKRVGKAITTMERYLVLNPADDAARVQCIRYQFQNQQSEGLEQHIDQLSHDQTRFFLEAERLRAEHVERAWSSISDLLQNPTLTNRQLLLATQIAYDAGHLEQAHALVERLIQRDPFVKTFYFQAAKIRFARDQPQLQQQALQQFKLLERLDLVLQTQTVTRAEILTLQQQLHERFPQEAAKQHLFQCRLSMRLGNRSEAEAALHKLVVFPALPIARQREAATLSRRFGFNTLAETFHRQWLAAEPDAAPAIMGLAQVLIDAQRHAEGRQLLKALLEKKSYWASAHFTYGKLLLEEQREKAGRFQLERALDLAPWHAGFRIGLADLYLAQGDLTAFRKLLASRDDNDPQWQQYRNRFGHL